MVPDHIKKHSKRDLARKAFILKFKKKQAVKNSFKSAITVEFEKMKDFEEGIAG